MQRAAPAGPSRRPSSTVPRISARAELGLIGGSGFYEFFDGAERVGVETPFGAPSDDLVVGEVDGRTVAFLARHGQGHRFPPHRVNYRANLWALRSVGVRQVLSPCAVGSLRPELGPGTVVVPDQVVDRTWGREHTVYARRRAGRRPRRVRRPVLPARPGGLLEAARAAASRSPTAGPSWSSTGRASPAAESRWHQQAGWSIVGMTAMPEAAIARELAMCFTTIALVTDHDAGVDGGEAVTHEAVLAEFARNVEGLKDVLRSALAALPDEGPADSATCACRRALDGHAAVRAALTWPAVRPRRGAPAVSPAAPPARRPPSSSRWPRRSPSTPCSPPPPGAVVTGRARPRAGRVWRPPTSPPCRRRAPPCPTARWAAGARRRAGGLPGARGRGGDRRAGRSGRPSPPLLAGQVAVPVRLAARGAALGRGRPAEAAARDGPGPAATTGPRSAGAGPRTAVAIWSTTRWPRPAGCSAREPARGRRAGAGRRRRGRCSWRRPGRSRRSCCRRGLQGAAALASRANPRTRLAWAPLTETPDEARHPAAGKDP